MYMYRTHIYIHMKTSTSRRQRLTPSRPIMIILANCIQALYECMRTDEIFFKWFSGLKCSFFLGKIYYLSKCTFGLKMIPPPGVFIVRFCLFSVRAIIGLQWILQKAFGWTHISFEKKVKGRWEKYSKASIF